MRIGKSKSIHFLAPFVRRVPELVGGNFYDHDIVYKSTSINSRKVMLGITRAFFYVKNGVINLEIDSDSILFSDNFIVNNNEVSSGYRRRFIDYTDLDDGKDVIIPLINPGGLIYGHWLIDILPKIDIFRRFYGDLPFKLAIPDTAPDFCFDLLSVYLGGTKRIIKLTADKVYLGTIFLASPTRVHDELSEFSVALRGISDYMSNKGNKIYVSRGNKTDYRDLLNRDAVERLFERSGFEIVKPEKLRFLDQVKLFGGASIIAGEAGSGLHNTIFAPQGATVINIQSSRQNHFIQAGLCHWCEQNIVYITGLSTSDEWNTSYSVDLDAITEAMGIYS